MASVGTPPSTRRGGADICRTVPGHARQASFGRRVTRTWNLAGVTSNRSDVSVPISTSAPLQQGQVVVSGVLTGIGIGMALAATSNAIIESVPADQTGEAVSANTVVRTVGSSIGTAVVAALLAGSATPQGLPADFKTSMLQSIESGRRTEIDVVNGALVRGGERTGVPTPVNATLIAAVRGLETGLGHAQPTARHTPA